MSEAEIRFEVGDVVRKKAGGVAMLIREIGENSADCLLAKNGSCGPETHLLAIPYSELALVAKGRLDAGE